MDYTKFGTVSIFGSGSERSIKMYNIGDKIVYPMHGAGLIEGIEIKEILGEERKYYILNTPHGGMKVMIPVDKSDEIGVREIIDESQVEELLKVLSADSTPMPSNWNRRYRANMDKMKTGDILQVAEVARNLYRIDKQKSLSNGEKKMLANALQIMESELVLVKNITTGEAEKMICEVI